MFKIVDDAEVILNSHGVFKPCGLYRRGTDNRIYAKHGNSFIRLHAGHYTSKAGTSWEEIKFRDKQVTFTNLEGPVWQ